MNEAGRFADTVSELRDEGYEVDAWLAGWRAGDFDPDDVAELVDYATDADDPSRNFVVIGTTKGELNSVFDWTKDDGNPLRCVIGADSTLSWCDAGHGLADEQADAVREAF